MITDATGSLINRTTYSSFGQIIGQTNLSETDRFGFTGREHDAESGLLHYRARGYDASSGKFLQRDPLGLVAGDVNFTRYVGNAPTEYRDPLGLTMVESPAITTRTATPLLSLTFLAKLGLGVVGGGALGAYVGKMTGFGGVIGNVFDTLSLALQAAVDSSFLQAIIGNNPQTASGRINTDMPGGDEAAEELFEQITKGQATTDPNTGHQVGPNGERLRTGKDGRKRIDIPARGGNPHETIHFIP